MTEKQTISQVVSQKLCNTCGGCFSVCPTQAIHYQETTGGYYLPVVDEEACTHCGLCYEVCPGIHFGDTLTAQMPDDPFSGHVLKAFVGKSTDNKIYENSQSGGIVSALLVHALASQFADAAVTVAMDWGNPPRPKVYLARSTDEIISAQNSKYCPIPTLSAIREIIDSDKKIIFVGTACQVHGLFNIMDIMPRLKDRISLIIGLVCDSVMTYAALDYLIYQSKLSDGNKKKLIFRDKSCGGYPGNVHIQSVDGQDKILPAKARMRVKVFFTAARCRICFDKMNVFSDIVVGDPHGIPNVDRKMGESIAIIRTTRGRSFFDDALQNRAFSGRGIPYQDILTGQKIDTKRIDCQGYLAAWEKIGRPLPNYCEKLPRPNRNNEKYYLSVLENSLTLDDHVTMEEYFRFVDRRLLIKKLRNLISWPPRRLKILLAEMCRKKY